MRKESTTIFEYDENGNLVVEITDDDDGTRINYKYDEEGRETYKETIRKEIVQFKTYREYNTSGKLSKFTATEHDNQDFEEIFEYDENGNLIYTKTNYGEETWYRYNDENKVILYEDSDGCTRTYEYNEDGDLCYSKISLEDGDDREGIWEYDENHKHQISYMLDGDQERKFRYDERGNKIYQSLFNYDRGDEEHVTTYAYDANNNCILEENEYQVIRCEYDSNNRKIRSTTYLKDNKHK